MNLAFDKPISIFKLVDEATESWEEVFKIHARINKSKSDNEYLSGGAIQGKRNLTFEIRYFTALEDMALNIQSYRIVYQDVPYDIKDYDDFMLQHKTVKILGVSC